MRVIDVDVFERALEDKTTFGELSRREYDFLVDMIESVGKPIDAVMIRPLSEWLARYSVPPTFWDTGGHEKDTQEARAREWEYYIREFIARQGDDT